MFTVIIPYKGLSYVAKVYTSGRVVIKQELATLAEGTWRGSYVQYPGSTRLNVYWSAFDKIDLVLRKEIPAKAPEIMKLKGKRERRKGLATTLNAKLRVQLEG